MEKEKLDKYKEQVIKLNKVIKEKNNIINNKEIELLKLSREVNSLGFSGYEHLYILSEDKKGVQRKYKGFYLKESIFHLKLLIYDMKNNDYYSYSIKKENIIAIKEYYLNENSQKELKHLLEIRNKKGKVINGLINNK